MDVKQKFYREAPSEVFATNLYLLVFVFSWLYPAERRRSLYKKHFLDSLYANDGT